MPLALELTLAVGAVLAVAVSAAVAIGARRKARDLDALVQSLLVSAPVADTGPMTTPADLPAPVARYLSRAIPNACPIRVARLSQTGTLRPDARSGRWMAFEATHTAAPLAKGFVWDARVSIAPLLHVRVRDALVEGRGSGQVALMSAFAVEADSGRTEMNSGSLHRFLAEAVWYPTALIPGENLNWEPVDDARALATLTVGQLEVSLEFRFGDAGEVLSIYTPGRWGRFEGRYEQLPWEGHFARYAVREGFRVPVEGEVGWYFDGDWQPVWRGTITNVAFEF